MVTIRKGYVDSSVGQIHYRYAGEGEPLLLLHQSATSSVVYEPIIQHLASNYSTVAMDTPGFGMSDYPEDKFTVPQFAKIVLEFMDAECGRFPSSTTSCTPQLYVLTAACWRRRGMIRRPGYFWLIQAAARRLPMRRPKKMPVPLSTS